MTNSILDLVTEARLRVLPAKSECGMCYNIALVVALELYQTHGVRDIKILHAGMVKHAGDVYGHVWLSVNGIWVDPAVDCIGFETETLVRLTDASYILAPEYVIEFTPDNEDLPAASMWLESITS